MLSNTPTDVREEGERDRKTSVEGSRRKEQWATQTKLMRILRLQQDNCSSPFILDLHTQKKWLLLVGLYPVGYVMPISWKFDGSRSAPEQLLSFLDDLGVH